MIKDVKKQRSFEMFNCKTIDGTPARQHLRYKRARNEYIRIRGEEQRNFEETVEDKRWNKLKNLLKKFVDT